MILPDTYAGVLFLLIVSVLMLGSWPNTLKLAGKWRFELFYFDYAFGALLAALIASFTFGSFGHELSFLDNLTLTASKRQILYAFVAGGIFNLANMLLVAAISVAGMAVAFPLVFGVATVVGVAVSAFVSSPGSPMLLLAGSGLTAAAVIVQALAYKARAAVRSDEDIAAGAGAKAVRGKQPKRKGSAAVKGILLSLFSGLLMGSFYPLVAMSKAGEFGLGPYALVFVFVAGIFTSTLLFNLFFMNLPVEGEPLLFSDYFRGKARQHALGILGGMMWCTGAMADAVATSAPEVNLSAAASYAFGRGSAVLSILWGLWAWKEFAGADARTKLLVGLMLIFFVAGLLTIALALQS